MNTLYTAQFSHEVSTLAYTNINNTVNTRIGRAVLKILMDIFSEYHRIKIVQLSSIKLVLPVQVAANIGS